MISTVKFSLTIIAILTLCACAHTNTAPLQLVNINVAPNIYRLTFVSKKNADIYQIQDYLIYKAAKLTLKNNYKYFEILENKYSVQKEHRGRALIAYTVALVKPLRSRDIERISGAVTIKMLDTNDNQRAMDAVSIVNSFELAKNK